MGLQDLVEHPILDQFTKWTLMEKISDYCIAFLEQREELILQAGWHILTQSYGG